MPRPPIDLRSDTVTRPTAAMRRAMAEAGVGDDVYGEDPTVNALEARTADLMGKEAALFVPSGTMANQIAIGLHAGPGDELICDSTAHVYRWEGGAIARHWGVTTRTVGVPGAPFATAAQIGEVQPDDPHYVRTRLVCLENTHNRGGGRILPIANVEDISSWARERGVAMHLDGARIMNAVVASGVAATEWARHFDTVSICFSKGLGAPVGSALAGTAEAIRDARRLRKLLGGGMRQAGLIAAAALYTLEHHVDRLAEDHDHAQILARAVEETDGLGLESGPVETNLVWIAVDPALGTAPEVSARLRERGVLVSALGPRVLRACTHLDVTRAEVEDAAGLIRQLAR
jgi:threonine aldolase